MNACLLILFVVTLKIALLSCVNSQCRDPDGIMFTQEPNSINGTVELFKSMFIPCQYQYKGSNSTFVTSLWMIQMRGENSPTLYAPGTMPPNHNSNNTGLAVYMVDMTLDGARYECCFDIAGADDLCRSNQVTLKVIDSRNFATTVHGQWQKNSLYSALLLITVVKAAVL